MFVSAFSKSNMLEKEPSLDYDTESVIGINDIDFHIEDDDGMSILSESSISSIESLDDDDDNNTLDEEEDMCIGRNVVKGTYFRQHNNTVSEDCVRQIFRHMETLNFICRIHTFANWRNVANFYPENQGIGHSYLYEHTVNTNVTSMGGHVEMMSTAWIPSLLPTIKRLRMYSKNVTDADVTALTTKVPNLVTLEIDDGRLLTNDCLKVILSSFKNLRHLCVLFCASMNDDGLEHIVNANLPLKTFALVGGKCMSETVFHKITETHPTLECAYCTIPE